MIQLLKMIGTSVLFVIALRTAAAVSPLLQLLQNYDTDHLTQLLQDVGYTQVRLGSYIDDANLISHSCAKATLRTTTTDDDDDDNNDALGTNASLSVPHSSPDASPDTSFLEIDQILEEEGPMDNLDCDCQPYSCTCQKQCFCRLSADPFIGTHYPPNANCPVCPSCHDTAPDNDEDQDKDDEVAKPDYKCSCSFEGVGGAGISNGGYMNCDCRVADCSCSKQCACTSKKKKTPTMRFHEVKEASVVKVPEGAEGAEEEAEEAKEEGATRRPPRTTTLLVDQGGAGDDPR